MSGLPLRAVPAGPEFRPFPRADVEGSIPARFGRQVEEHGERPAVRTRHECWSYRELDARAAAVAAALVDLLGPGPGRVALLFEHGAAMVAALLGALRAGKTYVPLDAAYPRERLAFMLSDSEAGAVVTHGAHLALARELAGDGRPVVDADRSPASGAPPAPAVEPDQPAYLLYTSGSTGRPKGVAQTHRNVLHHMRIWINALAVSPGDRLSLQSAYSWDSAVQDTFGALLSGATLCPVNFRAEGIGGLLEWLRTMEVTVYHSTLPIFRHLAHALAARGERLDAIRALALGGDAIYRSDVELYRACFAPGCCLINAYGATESSSALLNVCDRSTDFEGNVLPLGHPVDDTGVYLADGEGRPVPGLGEGEITLRSEFIAPGYWRVPEEDAGRFRPDPEGGRRRIYATGDLGRRLADGAVLLLGRKDFQVKIEGIRVELGEVEGTLKRFPEVRDAVVSAREDEPGERYLAAYVVWRKTPPADGHERLRKFLAASLPPQALPSAWVDLDALPLTVNAKIDRLALPVPARDRPRLARAYVPARTLLERRIAELWTDVLGVATVGVDDNFFDLGGTSVSLATLHERLNRDLDRGLSMPEMYRHPTIRKLVRRLDDGDGDGGLDKAARRAARRRHRRAARG